MSNAHDEMASSSDHSVVESGTNESQPSVAEATATADERHEEEHFPWYTPDAWYPVRLGEVLHARYEVLLKLGYGSVSTAWLCRDRQAGRHVTLKVYATGQRQARNEPRVLAHLEALETAHAGKALLRLALDRFALAGPRGGAHECLVHRPLAKSLAEIRRLCDGPVPLEVVKPTLQIVLLALDFLHRKAGVIHTDIGDENIMVETADNAYWAALEQQERAHPSARVTIGGRTVYASAALPMPAAPGNFVLCDFGDAQVGHAEFRGQCQPDVYRAPEIVVWAPFTRRADIWNVGMLAWTLVEGKPLFPITGYEDREASSAKHLARTIELLGPPPVELVARWREQESVKVQDFFDDEDIPLTKTSFEEKEAALDGQEKADFLAFLRRMLRWDPEERADAQDLLQDKWLRDLPGAPQVSADQGDAAGTVSVEAP